MKIQKREAILIATEFMVAAQKMGIHIEILDDMDLSDDAFGGAVKTMKAIGDESRVQC